VKAFEALLLRCFGIFGPETELDLQLADEGLKLVGDASAEPINSGFGMLPGA